MNTEAAPVPLQPLLPVGSLTWLGHIGYGLVALALIACLFAIFTAVRQGDQPEQLKRSVTSAKSACWFLFGAFAILITLFVTSQFQFRYVQRHSALDHELKYKVAGVWSGQEGSILLWAVSAAIFLLLSINRSSIYQRWFTVAYAAFLAGVSGILFFESPFFLNPPLSDLSDGFGMSPMLMNYWVVIHPPTIFLGFGSLAILFSFAVAAMVQKDLNSYIPLARPWAILALTLVGVGLCMGGFWAYETLGWGGFWIWDPVENTSFVPWVLLATFIHGIFVQNARNKWHIANLVFAGLPFLAFGYGTFLTRSGFLGDTSVHSFAQMDRSALWILIALVSISFIVFIAMVVRTAIWWKTAGPDPRDSSGLLQREAFFTTGNWLLVFLGCVTGFGMSVPLVQSLLGQQPKIVEEQLYNTITSLAFLPLIVLMAIGPFLTWRSLPLRQILPKFINIFAATIGTVGFVMLWMRWGGQEVDFGPLAVGFPGHAVKPDETTRMLFGAFHVYTAPWVLFLTAICLFALYANLWRMAQIWKVNKTSFGGMLTHFGVIMAMTGLIFSRGLQQKVEGVVHSSKTFEAFGYGVNLKGITTSYTDRNNQVRLEFTKDGQKFTATPGLYFIPNEEGLPSEFVWPYIRSHLLYDIYILARAFEITENGMPDFGGSVPVGLLPGQRAEFNGYVFQYNGLRTEGTPGTFGATFRAPVTVFGPDGESVIEPYIKLLGPGEMERPVIPVGSGMGLMIDRIDAADKTAYFTVKYLSPAYPVQIFYKPLTGLVWWGVSIMTIGGFIAAYGRRKTGPKSKSVPEDNTASLAGPPNPKESGQAEEPQNGQPRDKDPDAPQHPLEV